MQIHEEWNSVPRQTRPFDDVPETLRRIKKKGHTIGLISNTDEDLRPFLAKDGLLPLFDAVLLSFEVGRIKLDPEIFLEAATGLKLRPRKCVHIGDDVTYDVEGAKAAGMTPILIDRKGRTEGSKLDGTLISSLNELLDLI
ncbi:MAG: HAD family hydrolase [Candidatus Geothermarchaeales archaeon]